MTKSGQDYSRRSRWIWEEDDIIIIKKSDEQPQTAPDQAEGETPAAANKVDAGNPAKGDESGGQ